MNTYLYKDETLHVYLYIYMYICILTLQILEKFTINQQWSMHILM